MLEQHIADGVLTAQMNNITNFSFLHGRAEEQLGDLLRTLEGRNKEIVCILDPPKLGVNKRSTLTDLGKGFFFNDQFFSGKLMFAQIFSLVS